MLETLDNNKLSSLLIQRLSALPLEAIRTNDAFDHGILWYGVEALSHIVLLSIAKELVKDKAGLEAFIEEYGISFPQHGIKFNLYKLRESSFYIPPQRVGPCLLFDRDDLNHLPMSKVSGQSKWDFNPDFNHWFELADRQWSPSDLLNTRLLTLGIQFGFELWRLASSEMGNYSPEYRPTRQAKGPARLLAMYYENLAVELMTKYGPKYLSEAQDLTSLLKR